MKDVTHNSRHYEQGSPEVFPRLSDDHDAVFDQDYLGFHRHVELRGDGLDRERREWSGEGAFESAVVLAVCLGLGLGLMLLLLEWLLLLTRHSLVHVA
jgi:hypothetical protein